MRRITKLGAVAVIAAGAIGGSAAAVSAHSDHGGYGDHGHRGRSIQHVLLISVDGMHQSDLDWYIANHPNSELAKLASGGAEFANNHTSDPSDSDPGGTALMTGGDPRATGVYYDVEYSHDVFPPGTTNCSGPVPGGNVTCRSPRRSTRRAPSPRTRTAPTRRGPSSSPATTRARPRRARCWPARWTTSTRSCSGWTTRSSRTVSRPPRRSSSRPSTVNRRRNPLLLKRIPDGPIIDAINAAWTAKTGDPSNLIVAGTDDDLWQSYLSVKTQDAADFVKNYLWNHSATAVLYNNDGNNTRGPDHNGTEQVPHSGLAQI